ncbi:MAG: hypothetical protein MJA29_13820 [Candidatus Omnitrophica bacterium]|nr:hypothetical protein [Candidatus Omnitrophota bacterium]
MSTDLDLSKLTKAQLVELLKESTAETDETVTHSPKPSVGPTRFTKQDNGLYTLHITVKDVGEPVGKTGNKKRDDHWLFKTEGRSPSGKTTVFETLNAKSPRGRVTAIHLDVIEFQETK